MVDLRGGQRGQSPGTGLGGQWRRNAHIHPSSMLLAFVLNLGATFPTASFWLVFLIFFPGNWGGREGGGKRWRQHMPRGNFFQAPGRDELHRQNTRREERDGESEAGVQLPPLNFALLPRRETYRVFLLGWGVGVARGAQQLPVAQVPGWVCWGTSLLAAQLWDCCQPRLHQPPLHESCCLCRPLLLMPYHWLSSPAFLSLSPAARKASGSQ